MSSEEEVVPLVSAGMIDGTPIAYIAIWAALVAIMAMLPFSVVIGGGGSFPMSLFIYGLVGILLGPIAGAIATAIGSIIAVIIAPYTSIFGFLGFIPPTVATFMAGLITYKKGKPMLNILIAIVGALLLVVVFYFSFPISGVDVLKPEVVLIGVTDFWPGWILLLVTSKWIRDWVQSEDPVKLALSVFIITYFVNNTYEHYIGWIMFNFTYGLPIDVCIWIIFAFTWWERLAMGVSGMVIGTAVIIALRRAGIRKPIYTIW